MRESRLSFSIYILFFKLETISLIKDEILSSNSIPVQMQLRYIAEDGSELLKVITKLQQVTDDEKLVERSNHSRLLYLLYMIQATTTIKSMTIKRCGQENDCRLCRSDSDQTHPKRNAIRRD